MLKKKVGLYFFVKTPGLSPIKTRLASGIGRENTDVFYRYALQAIEAIGHKLMEEIPTLQVYWAVAEETGLQDPCWKQFPTLSQGEGPLADRLSCIYDQAFKRHQQVIFMGSDSPHLIFADLKKALINTPQDKFILGKTLDGGFYYFSSGFKINRTDWNSVEYSSNQTADQLVKNFSKIAPFQFIGESFDIDTKEDLLRYKSLDLNSEIYLDQQITLFKKSRELLT
ncbi:MAG: hypothetical protein COW00_01000 [Bdellovibrio sp. CG12_big_fil_rev_8_21_14_0_65_39_13]|nr:MAG: hypothetical protein COW78_10295 [Bdellovibrio sp. CG22_combo_CG10-13_8_21_14_all_39_27]PIQ62731.1 MAG: hypothetical protein COW00_01000 [Bdellovibrio sp. CG12_big_fil_rev_8_21_14_0_65_39_13]PIR36053.1 MAG: hypothetical protein COV37_05220 [Bdellovibrio sp. CG11_big_fil_rev_8_21_14_0_20_39_38]PJB53117.1 MAG: hypothetical protein CO099_08930 [Bdellovibrio sp. CG_4_9_14_3_um_filter_39_7]